MRVGTRRVPRAALVLALVVALLGVVAPSASAAGESIQGTITSGGVGVDGATVTVWDTETFDTVEVTTDSAGDYSASVPAGSYLVQAQADALAERWWPNARNLDDATPVNVGAGATVTGIDLTLPALGSISGVVTGPGSTPLESVSVLAVPDDANSSAQSAVTDVDGTYLIEGLEPGDYRVEFQPSDDDLGGEWYDDAPSAATATLVTVAEGETTPDIDAQLTTGATISGRVTGTGGVNLADVLVSAMDPDGGSARSAYTAADGTYTVQGLAAGSYLLSFVPSDTDYVSEYWQDAADEASATPVSVTKGQVRTGFDAQLASPGAISGTVSVTGIGADPSLVSVQIERAATDGDVVAVATPDPDGTYEAQVPAGQYVVRFTGGLVVDEWWNNAATREAATPVTVNAGGTTSGINASVVLFGSVAGVVTADGTPVADRGVRLEKVGGTSDDTRFTTTDEDGAYEFFAVEPGSYRVVADGDLAERQVETYHPSAANQAGAATVVIASGQARTDVDVALLAGATITGRVTAAPGIELETQSGVVRAYAVGGALVAETTPDEAGLYELVVPPGQVQVQFLGFSGYESGFDSVGLEPEWFDGAATRNQAQSVAASAGGVTTGIDAELVAGTATISGKITGPGGPVNAAFVSVLDGETGSFLAFGDADEQGNYTVTGVPSGSLVVEFNPYGASQNLLDEYYSDKATFDTANRVAVTKGQAVTSIDAALEPEAVITGKVTGPGGMALPNVLVEASSDGDTSGSIATTANDGTYRIGRLRAGTYGVAFQMGSENRWFDGKTAEIDATPVPLTTGQSRPNVDATFANAAVIGGTITDPDGGPMSYTFVEVVGTDGTVDYISVAAEDGAWATAVPAGSYTVRFDAFSDVFRDEWWQNATSEAAATPVAVTAGQSRLDVNAQLEAAATIRGTVTRSGGFPLDGISVAAIEQGPGGDRTVASTLTKADGSYALFVPAGTYKVEFADPYDNYDVEYWDDVATLAQATPITLADGQTASGRDAELSGQPFGTLAGTVSAPSGPVQGAFIQACSSQTFACTSGTTNATGAYSIPAPVGDLTVSVWPPGGTTLLGTRAAATVTQDQTTTLNLTLRQRQAPPTGTTITGGFGSSGGVPTVVVGQPFTLKHQACTTGTVDYTISNGREQVTGTLIEVSVGLFERTITLPFTGEATVTLTDKCPGDPPAEVKFDIYIDPSGVVSDTKGAPITGATVTLYRSDASTGPFTVVPDGSDIMSPSNRTNPDTTGADGRFAWDTIAGWYKVRASKPGCHKPGDPSTAFVETAALPVPPPQLDLSLVLECPPTSIVVTTKPVLSGSARVGSTLSVTKGAYNVAATVGYQWLRGGAPIAGATKSTYKPVAADVGKAVSARVSASKSGLATVSSTTAAKTVAKGPALTSSAGAKVSGKAKVGKKLTVKPGTWVPAASTYSYVWKVGAKKVGTATTLKLKKSWKGKKVTVVITARKAGYADGTKSIVVGKVR